MSEKYRYLAILGHGGGRQEGGRKWAGGGGDSDFSGREGEALFASGGGGEGYCKISKRAIKMHFSKKFWKYVQNMCNFAFLGTFFIISTWSMGKKCL